MAAAPSSAEADGGDHQHQQGGYGAASDEGPFVIIVLIVHSQSPFCFYKYMMQLFPNSIVFTSFLHQFFAHRLYDATMARFCPCFERYLRSHNMAQLIKVLKSLKNIVKIY